MNAGLLAENLSGWIKDKVLEAGCKGTVLGMSGGIDSSVVGALCIKVFPNNTLGLIMPCHSTAKDKEHAENVAKKFSIPTKTVALDDIYDAYLKILPDFKPEPSLTRLAQANLKARLRMITLYYTANQTKYLVIGSGNRSELTVGYFTKHGDSGVDVLPLGNLVKREVRELARFLKIPPEIIDKAPSAGLWAGQTDEGEMGFSYEALDNYILTGDAPAELKKRIEMMRANSAHKCTTPPVPEF
ncbi:MAG: NAD(+) synthase [Chloroflexi bacterium RBG_16_50_11]|nr:MAG: NAD(+) synthase [Chloroflexi bacterium RBG_16_50_11]